LDDKTIQKVVSATPEEELIAQQKLLDFGFSQDTIDQVLRKRLIGRCIQIADSGRHGYFYQRAGTKWLENYHQRTQDRLHKNRMYRLGCATLVFAAVAALPVLREIVVWILQSLR